jgi:putative transposase
MVRWYNGRKEVTSPLTAMRRALTQATPYICNSDQGSHFTSPQYQELLLTANVQISMDGKERALDNIFTERVRRCACILLVGGVQHH